MSVIRADQVAAEAQAESAAETDAGDETGDAIEGTVQPQYVFTMTDGGFAKRTRITDYRQQSRGGLGIKTMSLTNEDRGGLVGAFIVVEGDEILSITAGGQVVRSPINDQFRPTGRDTMGVKFVTPKSGDSVAVVTRSVESPEELLPADGETEESPDVVAGATIEGSTRVLDAPESGEESELGAVDDPESEG
jgi:DNA gyrase subunit A